MALLTFLLFTGFVAFYATWKLRRDKLNTRDGYFLGGRSLTGIVIAGSMLLTNISTEHLVGMNGSSYRNGAIIVAWEVTSALALVIAALYFVPRYLKMGLTTIPEFLEKRFDGLTRTLVALLLIISFVATSDIRSSGLACASRHPCDSRGRVAIYCASLWFDNLP